LLCSGFFRDIFIYYSFDKYALDQSKLSGLTQVTQLAKAVCADEELINELEKWTVPVFPVKGLDLMNAGVKKGPKMKLTLTYLFALWQKVSETYLQRHVI
ncbi:hypothetical protein COOONC_22523, partial [Cooperia oncophora]